MKSYKFAIFFILLAVFSAIASTGAITSLYGGAGGSIPYQSAANTTAFLANGSAGQVLTSQGTTLAPIWAAAGGGIGGSGTATHVPMFSAGTTLADTPMTFASNTYVMANSGGTSNFYLALTPSSTVGTFSVGDLLVNRTFLNLDESTSSAELSGNTVTIGKNTTNTGILDLAGTQNIKLQRTITTGGTTGDRTINKPSGTVNFAIGATTIVVTNSTVTANSLIFVTPQVIDGTCKIFCVTARGAGTFTIQTPSGCFAETPVAFLVTN